MVATDTDLATEETVSEEEPSDLQADDTTESEATIEDAETSNEQGEPDSGAAPIDVNAVFDSAVALTTDLVPGSSLSPIEPVDGEPSQQSIVLVGPGVVLVDAVDHQEPGAAIAVADAIRRVADAITTEHGYDEIPIEEASDDHVQALMAATTFKTVLSTDDGELGEIRMTVATLGATENSAPAEPEVSPENETPTEPMPAAEPPPLAERLPNLAAVDMNVSVELGRVRLPIRELLGLGTGSVIRLGTPIGESFDILVNGKPAARGDLVVVGGRLAVRIRELLGVDG